MLRMATCRSMAKAPLSFPENLKCNFSTLLVATDWSKLVVKKHSGLAAWFC